jgi:cell division septum initiation protein DivIVA
MTDYTVKELEEKIMNGETVSSSEMANAMRNADAAQRIAELNEERIVRTAQADVAKLAALKKQFSNAVSPTEQMSLGYEINDLEKKINDTNK